MGIKYDLAFNDVLQSFKYFINNINNDSFFILVGHSQKMPTISSFNQRIYTV